MMKLIPTVMAAFGLALLAGGLHVQTVQECSKEVHSLTASSKESHGRKPGVGSSGGWKIAVEHEIGNGLKVACGGDVGHGLTDTRESHG